MKCWLKMVCGLMLVLPTTAAQAQGAHPLALPPVLLESMHGINGARIADHISFLSSDLLEGRGTIGRGGRIAAAYIATQFALDGIRPAAGGGRYLQTFQVDRIQTDPQTQLNLEPATGSPIPLKYGADDLVTDQTGASHTEIAAPVVFVGYGIDDPATGRDDYRGADVKGKVALMFEGLPPGLTEMHGLMLPDHDDGSIAEKLAQASKHGAVAALVIHENGDTLPTWAQLRNVLQQGTFVLPVDAQSSHLRVAGWIQADVARLLFAASGLSLNAELKAAANGSEARQLPVQLDANVLSTVTASTAANVIGILPGRSSGQAARDITLYAAHYGGLGQSDDGSRIYSGAVDNASGVGMLLELARGSALAAVRPPHPMLFVATAGDDDEIGVRYFVRHPPLSIGNISLAIDFDTVLPIGLVRSVVVSGVGAGRFKDQILAVAKTLNLRLEPDDSALISRRIIDQILPFAREGVPAITVNQGYEVSGYSREWVQKQLQDYRMTRYRQPADRFLAKMNFSGNAQLVRYALALGWTAGQLHNSRTANLSTVQDQASAIGNDHGAIPSTRSETTCSGC